MALIDDKWLQTYALTPAAENIYQEYRTCPEGKEINKTTGNCVDSATIKQDEKVCPEGKYLNPETNRCRAIESNTQTSCKDGYYRNPETGRCKKLPEGTALEACPDGYERNPETNRCRKIRTSDASSYPVTEVEASDNYENPKIFIAVIALVVAAVLALAYIGYQFRYEIYHFLRRHFRNGIGRAKL